MSMIKVDNLTFAYPTSYDNIFENVSFQIDTDWRLGFVGRNGRGKTTFLLLEGEGAHFAVQCEDNRLDVQLENDLVKITGGQAVQNVRLVISAQKEGYQNVQRTLLVTVGDPPLQVELTTSNLDLQEPSIEQNGASAITLKTTPTQANITAQAANPSIVDIQVVNNHVLLYGKTLGKTTVTIRAQQEGYAPYETQLEIEVTGPKTPFVLPDTIVRVQAGGQLELPFELIENGTLELEYDQSVFLARQSGNKLLITGVAPGEGVLRIRAQHQDYTQQVKTVRLLVSKPALEFINLPKTLAIAYGGSYMLPVQASESGVDLSVIISQNIAQVSVIANQIYIQAQSAGQAVLMVTATKDGFEEVVGSINLSVYNQTMQCPISRENITIVANQSEEIQVYPPQDCRITVHSTSPLISASVQGNTVTVFSKGEVGTAQLTITVSKPGYYNVTHTVNVQIIA